MLESESECMSHRFSVSPSQAAASLKLSRCSVSGDMK